MSSKKKRHAIVGKQCVACGVCVNECPRDAISIFKGLYAKVNEKRCIGCGRCKKACPASIIAMLENEVL